MGSNVVKVTIPPLPFETTGIFDVDEQLIASIASDYISVPPVEASAPYFFLGHLPMWSVDGLCVETRDRAYVRALLGNFMVSGFYGGVWLRDEIKLSAFRGTFVKLLFNVVHRGALKLFEFIIGKLVNAAFEGSDRTVRTISRLSIEPFLILNGYNWGYFDYIVKNPPGGVEPPERYRELGRRFLDWRMPGVQTATLERYKPALDRLYSRRVGRRWSEMRNAVKVWKGFSAATGRFVWRHIMNDSMPRSVYELLLELSARFLLIAKLCILPAMNCYADHDIVAGRDALLEQAAMIAWGGSYMVGLTSDQPEGTFPLLELS